MHIVMTREKIINTYLPNNTLTQGFGRVILIPVDEKQLHELCLSLSLKGLPLKNMFACDDTISDSSFRIFYVFGVPVENFFLVPYLTLIGTTEFPSLTPVLHQASVYEPYIHEMFGLVPIGYPGALGSVVLHEAGNTTRFPMRINQGIVPGSVSAQSALQEWEFLNVDGEGIFEVPVGPVHAGIIEPGHFRFAMAGEIIAHLEAKLGWVHKGTEKLFEKIPLAQAIRLSERIAGDTSFAHSVAFANAIETLGGIKISNRAKYLRVIYGELERMANHCSDIGYILSDTGLNFGGAQCSRLREQLMRYCDKLTGSRFLRGVNTIGGVQCDINKETGEQLLRDLRVIQNDLRETLDIVSESSILANRMEGTGTLHNDIVKNHDAVGVAARASGIACDARIDFPYAAYDELSLPIIVLHAGDVHARFMVRISEFNASIELIEQALRAMPEGELSSGGNIITLPPNSLAVGIAEGWRGDICYCVLTDAVGKVKRVSARDPSFINWHLVPHAAQGNVLLDFPLINKSFNLSYSGFDR